MTNNDADNDIICGQYSKRLQCSGALLKMTSVSVCLNLRTFKTSVNGYLEIYNKLYQ